MGGQKAMMMWLCVALVLAASPALAARHPGFSDASEIKATRIISYTSEAEADRVTSLPGLDGPAEGLFSGYITANEEYGRHLFYAFVEAKTEPDTKPLLLWLNGGPGCSSIGGGFMSELGPFLPLPGGRKLQRNMYSWHRVANVLFVESPAFVGFSYSETASDAIVGDKRTAQDMRGFLLGFIRRFPHLADRDLYLSGESYAGHYVPTLAWEIVQGNEEALSAAAQSQTTDPRPPTPEGYLNLKGAAVGNPWTDAQADNSGCVDFWWAHALISDKTAKGIREFCDFTKIGPLDIHSGSRTCDDFVSTAVDELGPINIYHIFADVCTDPGAAKVTRALAAALSAAPSTSDDNTGTDDNTETLTTQSSLLGLTAAASFERIKERAVEQYLSSGGVRGTHTHKGRDRGSHVRDEDPDDDDGNTPYDACVDDEVFEYLNLPEVQRALHANVTGQLPGPWSDCTRRIMYSRQDLLSSMLPIWERLVETPGLRFLVYSGDVDGIVPVVGTRRWVAGLGLPEARAWRPWLSGATQQVGGWTIEYHTRAARSSSTREDKSVSGQQRALEGNFVFASVRGAGHMVPYVQPGRALHMMSRWLANEAL